MKNAKLSLSNNTLLVSTALGDGRLRLTEKFLLQSGGKTITTRAAYSPHLSVCLMGIRDQCDLALLPKRPFNSFYTKWVDEQVTTEEQEQSSVVDADETTGGATDGISQEALLHDKIAAIPFLKDDEREELTSILSDNKEAWSNQSHARVSSKARFEVSGKPFKARLRHYEPPQMEEMEKQLSAQLKAGIIRKSTSEWSASPHFVAKSNGAWRMVIDYRHLNAAMVSDNYPIPRLWDCLQKVAGHKYYIVMDITAGFWNIPLEEECKHYTSFVTPFGTYEFNVLPFGIKNSPSIF